MRILKLILCLLFLTAGYSQERKKLPLISILNQITQTHGAKFGYIEEELIVYKLIPPEDSLPLKAKLDYIEKNTRLRFESVVSNYYTVFNNRKMDKPLCGFLIDSDTGGGIENAEVLISGTVHSTASDANGYFELPVLSPNEILIRHLNYPHKSIDPQDLYITECPKILLIAKIEELVEVVSQRYLATGIIKNDFGELVVRPEKFGILPGLTDPDVLQTMQQIPGITSVDETVSNLNVRGGTHDQNLFLWNGIPMFQTGHFFGLISAFNPLLPTRITIFKNGTPAFFGESVSSLIDISTHSGIPDTTTSTIALDMVNINLLSKVKISDKAAFQISGRRTYSDIYATPTFRDYQQRIFQNTIVTDLFQNQVVSVKSDQEFYFYDLSLQYHQKIGLKHELIADGLGLENRADISQQTGDALKESRLSQKNFGGSVSLKSEWNNKHKSEFQAYISWYNLDATHAAIEFEAGTKQRNSVSDKGIRVKHSYVLSKQMELSAGYQFDEFIVKNLDEINAPAFLHDSKEISGSHALIAEFHFHSEDGKSQLRAGIRENYFAHFRKALAEPRIVISQALSENFKLEAIGEMKSQSHSQIIDQQQDFLGIEKRRWVLSNETDVPIIKSSQASLGLTYSNRGWLVVVDNFFKKISGITSGSQGFQNQFESANAVGEYRVSGSELLLQKSFKRFYSWISYSFNNNKYIFNGLEPKKFSNNNEILHSVSWAGIYEWRKVRIAIGSKWNTGRPVTTPSGFIIDSENPDNSEIIYNAPNNDRLRDYIQVNFSASKSWTIRKTMQLTASASVLNILDRNNVINRYYRVNTGNNSVESIDTYSLGRTPNIGMKLFF